MTAPLPKHGLVAGLIAPVAAVSLFGLSLSMSYPLTGLLLERMDASGVAIGLSATAAAVTMVLGAPLMPRILGRLGLGPMLIGAALILSAMMMAFPLMPDYWAWVAIRMVMGLAGTAVFFVSEYWIVATAPEGARGRAIAIYTISLSVTFGLGPVVVGLTGVEGYLPFALGAAVLALGTIPVVWGLSRAPKPDAEGPADPRAALRFFVTDPALLWGVVLFGTIEFGAIALLPVWGVRTGLSESDASILMGGFAAGSILFQWPTGWAADRFDRRRMLAVAAGLSVLAPLLLILVSGSYALAFVAVMLWGGAAVALYSLALTELGARHSGRRLAEGNAAVILGYGIGALVAPLGLGHAMDALPPHGVLWGSAAVAAVYLALVLARMARAPRPGP